MSLKVAGQEEEGWRDVEKGKHIPKSEWRRREENTGHGDLDGNNNDVIAYSKDTQQSKLWVGNG